MSEARAAAGLALTTAAVTPTLFAIFLPGLHEMPSLNGAEINGFRRGELYGSILAVGLGLGTSLMAKCPWPFLVSVAMTAGLLHVYETALKEGKSA